MNIHKKIYAYNGIHGIKVKGFSNYLCFILLKCYIMNCKIRYVCTLTKKVGLNIKSLYFRRDS